jgi:hypothetical protein
MQVKLVIIVNNPEEVEWLKTPSCYKQAAMGLNLITGFDYHLMVRNDFYILQTPYKGSGASHLI